MGIIHANIILTDFKSDIFDIFHILIFDIFDDTIDL